ncbi:hypothetical protein SAMN02927921_00002 [Sinomicrobium oceani]|uniref:Uncharacterized protein n=1 Tax=Sinomicrobium oceani TaxID=1150368 RepID=A0A1K1LK81_9FLAO|nr:hypothetical protein SAMN02927921_00002 [Sinomicrobium oceani]
MATFIKPDLKFFLADAPTTGIIIQMDYEKARTRDEVFGLVHKWLDLSGFVVNEGNRMLYKRAAMWKERTK